MAQTSRRDPLVLVDTTNLSREDWLAYRRQGIGGSDAAAVLGISPFRTAVDLYYDKLNRPIEDDGGNWVAMEVGTLLEDLVARIFAQKTGLKVYQRKCMFRYPDYPWMLAGLDYLVEMPDGSTAILECKTTNYNARGKWEYDGKPIVPVYYEVQGRHYMAVMNLNRVYYCCLYGNNEDEVIIRYIDRERQPEKLLEIRGITEECLEEIKNGYATSKAMRDLMTLLAPFKVTPTTALKIYHHFGPSGVPLLRKSPFRLCQIPGFGFKRVDVIVQKSGGDLHDPMRVHPSEHSNCDVSG